MPKLIDLSGTILGRLIVISYQGDGKYLCHCSCGNMNHITRAKYIQQKRIKSCGCLYHNMTNSPEYQSWRGMKQRCYYKYDKDYHNYGGRDIKVCERWLHSFVNFYEDMGEKPSPKNKYSLDRINVNGDYTPQNCRWATSVEQSNNTRETIYIEYNNKKLTARDWSKLNGIKPELIRRRIHSGWTPERALNYWGKDE